MKKIQIIIGLILITTCTLAQTNVYNSGQLYISNSADTVFITGSLTNTASANLNNAGGNLFVQQDVTNNQVGMVAGTGKLWSKGSTLQNFYGNSPFKTYNWIVDNANNINLQNRVEIGNGTAGNLSFVNGKITSGTTMQDVTFNEGSTYSGFSNSNHIIGYCSKVGNTNFTFPIGDGNFQADLDISNLTSNTTFQSKYFGTTYSTLTPSLPLISVFDKEYWTLSRTTGSSSTNITLKWNDLRKILNHNDPTGLRVGHYTGSSWISEGGVGSGNTTTGSVTSLLVNSFSPFTFASESSVVPIMLNSVHIVSTANCNTTITWIANEDGKTNKYIIQKKINNNWIDIGSQLSKANNSNAQYNFTDFNAQNGNNYYRIAVKNITGNITYSPIKLATINCIKDNIQVYPTITKTNITISLSEASNVIIVNNNGQKMLQKQLSAGNTLINLYNYINGIYYVSIANEKTNQTFKILKY